jgi:uncharacterized protein YlzI (FlbEa/FlbD family)
VILLTRLNNTRLAVNCDLIKYVEEAPDTVITLIHGEKLVVRETTAEVIERVRDFRRSISRFSVEGCLHPDENLLPEDSFSESDPGGNPVISAEEPARG